MSFKEKKYSIIKSAISPELVDFVSSYFLLKRKVATTLFAQKYISPFVEEWGHWHDAQIPKTYSHYADVAMETLLEKLLPLMQKETGLELVPTYSYARVYKTGDVLKRHKDRPSCEISTTLNLGGDEWPIFLEPNKNVGVPDGKDITSSSNNEGVKVSLSPGDMLIYSGCIFEHWREAFEGKNCVQVFLHYNNVATQGKQNIYDSRVHLGLPSRTRNI